MAVNHKVPGYLGSKCPLGPWVQGFLGSLGPGALGVCGSKGPWGPWVPGLFQAPSGLLGPRVLGAPKPFALGSLARKARR